MDTAPTGPTIAVQYTCHGCGIVDRAVDGVAERAADEDIVEWMKYVSCQVGLDHDNQSPGCRSGKVDLKIPVPLGENARLGAATRQ